MREQTLCVHRLVCCLRVLTSSFPPEVRPQDGRVDHGGVAECAPRRGGGGAAGGAAVRRGRVRRTVLPRHRGVLRRPEQRVGRGTSANHQAQEVLTANHHARHGLTANHHPRLGLTANHDAQNFTMLR